MKLRPKRNNTIKVLELFAGIGACSKALERLNIEHEIVDAVEIDKYAITSFNAIHGTNFEPQDITKWDKDMECDLIMHGSPCQDFSIAGKQAGGDEGSGTRSSLMYETLRIVEKLRPKYVIWENVKNLLSQKHVHNWDAYEERMEELGYTTYCQILNAKDYGIPQNRERVFTVSIYDGGHIPIKDFWYPEPIKLTKTLKDFLETNVDEKYYLSDRQIKGMIRTNYSSYKLSKLLKNNDSIIDTIKARFDGCPQCILVKNANKQDVLIYDDYNSKIRKDQNTIGTLTTNCGSSTIRNGWKLIDGVRIRKLTPRECWRLMGFDDEDFDKASKINSNTQLYKQAGNSIVVNVLEAILSNLLVI